MPLPAFVVLVGVVALAGVGPARAQVPPTLGAGSHVAVTRADGTTFTSRVSPTPVDPLWKFVDATGGAINFRLGQLVSVRLTGEQRRLVPRWSGAERVFPWARVRTTEGETLDLGVNGWPTFELVRDGGEAIVANAAWLTGLTAIDVVRAPLTLPGLATGARVRVSKGDGAVYEGTLSAPASSAIYGFLDFSTGDTWRVPLSDLHRFAKTGERRGIYDVVEVTLRDALTLTLGVSSWAAWDVTRDDTGRREVNSQTHAGFKAVEAIGTAGDRAIAAPPQDGPPADVRPTDAALSALHAEAAARYLEYRKSGDGQALGDAGALAEALVDADRSRAASWVLLGLLYRELSEQPATLALAEDAFARAVQLAPGDASAGLALGLALFDQGLYVPALDRLEAVLRAEAPRGEPGIIARMNEAYLRDGQVPRGVRFWREWLAGSPDADAARFALAILLQVQHNTELARAEVARVLDRPGAAPADKAYARVLLQSWVAEGGRP